MPSEYIADASLHEPARICSVPAWTPRHIALRQVRVSYVDTGPSNLADESEPGSFLLLHGGHGGWQHWKSNLTALSCKRRVVVPDMPGFGSSGDLPEPSIAGIVDCLDELIDGLDLRGIVLGGFSFGTLVASALAVRRPDRVRGLLLVNPSGLGPVALEAVRMQEEISVLTAREGRRAGVRAAYERLMLRNRDRLTEAVLDDLEQCVSNMRFFTRKVSRSADILSDLALVRVPVTVLIGRDDPFQRHATAERQQRIVAHCPHASVRIVSDAAHWLQHDRSEVFDHAALAMANAAR